MVQINTMKAQTEVKERENKLKSRHREIQGQGFGIWKIERDTERQASTGAERKRETGEKENKPGDLHRQS